MKLKSLATLVTVLVAAVSATAQTFTATTLTAPDNSQFFPTALNNKGEVVGRISVAGPALSHAALWRNGAATDLGTSAPEKYSWVAAINDNSVSVGGIGTSSAKWSGDSLTDQALPKFPVDINNAGQTVGSVTNCYKMGLNDICVTSAFFLNDGVNTPLSQLPDGETDPVAVNNNGVILGTVHIMLQGYDRYQALVYSGATPQKLTPAIYDVTDINDRGEILGRTSNWEYAVWKGGSVALVVPPAGYSTVETTKINNRSQIVGDVPPAGSGTSHAVLWDAGGPTILENRVKDLTVPLYSATGINDRGQILAYGLNAHYLLTPIYGDADGDYAVTVNDAAVVLRAASGLETSPCPWTCDVAPASSSYPGGFGDGAVDLMDAVRIIRYVGKAEASIP